jgi:hypothetical protein
MYYTKYLKYKNKYINLKYQLGGTFNSPLIKEELKSIIIPDESITLEPIHQTINSLTNNLIGFKVLEKNSTILVPFVNYNKEFKAYQIYFYRYTDKSGSYILCSLYRNRRIFIELQKKNVRIQKISIDEFGNVSLLIKNISTLKPSKELDLKILKNKLMDDLVGIKVLQTNSKLLLPSIKDAEFKNKIYYYTYADKDGSYILVSLYDYYEFLDILYEHIEIEEVEIDDKGVIRQLPTGRIYHRILKPFNMHNQLITLPLKKNTFDTSTKLIDALKKNPFIIIDTQDDTSELLLDEVCMYNLFIGTIHVFVIYVNNIPNGYFLLSLFTEYELDKYIGKKPANIKLYECRLYKQGNKIEFILYKDMAAMMFKIYNKINKSGYHKIRYYRGDSAIDNKFLDQLDPTLLKNFEECISVKDISFNTSLWLLPDKIEAKEHSDILEMEKNFINNKFELINSNEKIQLWRYNYEDLTQLWEYTLGDIREEVEKFKKKLLDLEPCHKELLVLKLNEKGFEGKNMDEILQNSALCYIDDKDKDKRLLYENSIQKDKTDEFVKNCKFIPEMKRLLETNSNPETEVHKYRQTIILTISDNEYIKKYEKNKSYFFCMSWYPTIYKESDEVFNPLIWSIKLNKLCFQCLSRRDTLIFPFRILNSGNLKSPLSTIFDRNKLEFYGYFYTKFTDNYDGIKKFDENCRDKFNFIYRYRDNTNNFSGKTYEIYYYTGNSIWFDISILPYYKVFLCEINCIYYTFILKYKTIPYFYEYINDDCEKEIVVSRFSLHEIYNKYEENSYNTTELADLKQVYYNHYYYKRTDINDKIFTDNSLFSTKEKENNFIRKTFLKNNISK